MLVELWAEIVVLVAELDVAAVEFVTVTVVVFCSVVVCVVLPTPAGFPGSPDKDANGNIGGWATLAVDRPAEPSE